MWGSKNKSELTELSVIIFHCFAKLCTEKLQQVWRVKGTCGCVCVYPGMCWQVAATFGFRLQKHTRRNPSSQVENVTWFKSLHIYEESASLHGAVCVFTSNMLCSCLRFCLRGLVCVCGIRPAWKMVLGRGVCLKPNWAAPEVLSWKHKHTRHTLILLLINKRPWKQVCVRGRTSL